MKINYRVVLSVKSVSLLGDFNFIIKNNRLEEREADVQKRKLTPLNAESGTIMQSMETTAALIGDVRSWGQGICTLPSSPQPRAFGILSAPTPGNLPSQKKMLIPRGLAQGEGGHGRSWN